MRHDALIAQVVRRQRYSTQRLDAADIDVDYRVDGLAIYRSYLPPNSCCC